MQFGSQDSENGTSQKSRDFQVMIDRTFIHLAIYFRTSVAWQCKLNLLGIKTGKFADQPHLHSMKVLLPWYNHPFRFDQLHGPIRTVLLLKIKTLFEITHAFQKMALVAEVLVSLRHFRLWWCFDTTHPNRVHSIYLTGVRGHSWQK